MYFSCGELSCENHHTLPIFRRQVSLSVTMPSVAAQCKHVGGAKLGFVFGELEQGASIHFQKLREALKRMLDLPVHLTGRQVQKSGKSSESRVSN